MYDKKILIIVRAALIVFGAAVGALGSWQYFVTYPAIMRKEFQVIVIIVCATVISAVLGFSAKPFYRLGASIKAQIIKVTGTLGAKGITAIVTGLVAAGLIAFLFDVILRESLTVLAVRILIDMLIAIVFAALCCYGFTKFLAAEDTPEEMNMPQAFGGYLLCADCFEDDRVYTACDALINIKVCDRAFEALSRLDLGKDAFDRLKTVIDAKAAALIRMSKDYDGLDGYRAEELKIAAARRLVAVTDAGGADNLKTISLKAFAMPSEKLMQSYMEAAVADNNSAAPKTVDAVVDIAVPNINDNEANGRIIIDK